MIMNEDAVPFARLGKDHSPFPARTPRSGRGFGPRVAEFCRKKTLEKEYREMPRAIARR